MSIDYSLSPDSAYPEALQEALDCYLWLSSKDPQVEMSIGFFPDKFAICGDSAGGNLSMALLLIVNEIRTSQSVDVTIQNPKGIFCYYTPYLAVIRVIILEIEIYVFCFELGFY